MKQRLLVLIMLFGLSRVFAQCVSDVTQTQPGFSPDSLPAGCVGQAYNQTVTLVFANDTSITTPLGPVSIDFLSYRITSITNLAPGISYECDNDSCEWLITQNQVNRGCVRFFGTPTTAGTDTMIVTVLATLNTTLVPPTSVPVPNPFTVKPAGQCTGTQMGGLVNADFARVYPNPGSNHCVVEFSAGANRLEVRDLTGKLVYEFANDQGFTKHEMNTGSWHSGMYFIQLNTPVGNQTLRWIHQ